MRQCGHNLRANLCATVPIIQLAAKYGSIPMSTSRIIALMLSFVCNVDKTKCPVNDACTPICAVSKSRISPIITMSGSWRNIERRAEANVTPAFSLT